MRITRITLIAFIFMPALCFSQDSLNRAKHLLSAEIGIQQVATHDLVLSPMNYSGSCVPLLLGYNNVKSARRHRIDFYFAKLSLEPASEGRLNNVYEEVVLADLAYQYDFILTPLSIGNLAAGLRWGTMIIPKEQHFKQYGFSQLVVDGFSDLSISTEYDVRISDKDGLGFSGKCALVAYVLGEQHSANQPPRDMLGTDHSFNDIITSGQFYFLTEFTDIQARLTYTRSISTRVHLVADWNFRFIRYPKTGPNEILIWGLTTGLIIDL